MANKRFRLLQTEVRRVLNRMLLYEPEEVVGGGPVAVDGVDGRPQDVLVVVEPPRSQVGDGDRLEAQRRRRADSELGVHLGGELPGGGSVQPDPWPVALPALVVAQVPDFVAAIAADFPDTER
jgi:hypothetical protein